MSIGTNSRAWNIDAANNPWVSKQDYKTQLKWLKDEYMTTFSDDSIASKMMTFDNWNELSEGHAIQPAGFNGFSCLDSIREVFCNDSSEHADFIPNEVQKERIRGMYPRNRKVLRYIKPVGDEDIPKKVGYGWYFNGTDNAWQITKQVDNLRLEDGVLKGTATGLRFDPFVGTGSFEIESIEFLQTDKRKAALYIDGEEFSLLKDPINIDGTLFFELDSVYDFWSELDLFARYRDADKTFTITDGKKTHKSQTS